MPGLIRLADPIPPTHRRMPLPRSIETFSMTQSFILDVADQPDGVLKVAIVP